MRKRAMGIVVGMWLVALVAVIVPRTAGAAEAEPGCRCEADCLVDDCSCFGDAGCFCGCSFFRGVCECY